MAKTRIAILAALASTALTGCWQMPNHTRPETVTQPPVAATAAEEKPESPVKRAAPELQSDTLVERVVILSERLQHAHEQVIVLQKDNRELEGRNRNLLGQMAKLQMDLTQTQKELADANDLLLEMRVDLVRWKENVLGFRQEMLASRLLLLKRVEDVIRLLGGVVEKPKPKPAAKEAAKSNEKPTQPGA